MKKMADLMAELGFRPEGSEAVKEAFIKNLIKAAAGAEVETPSEKRRRQSKAWTSPKNEEVNQLSFDLDNAGQKPKDPKKVG